MDSLPNNFDISQSLQHLGIDLKKLQNTLERIPTTHESTDETHSIQPSQNAAKVLQSALLETSINRQQHKSGLVPVIHNVVGAFTCGGKLNLDKIALFARNAEYNPRRFCAVICRIRDPKSTALIFPTGSVVVGGAKTEALCKLACRKFGRIIQKCGQKKVKFLNFRIINIVATVDCGFPIRLEALYTTHSDYANFDSELFSGIVYRMIEPKCVLLIFTSGRVVLVGAKSMHDVTTAFEQIYPVLVEFRKY